MQGSGSETRLVLDILHVTQECLKDIIGLKVHLLSQIILTHPLNNYSGAIFFRLMNDQKNYIVTSPTQTYFLTIATHVN